MSDNSNPAPATDDVFEATIPKPSNEVISESRLVGRVKWFNNKSGFGFITLCDGDDKDIFVHYSCLQAENSPYKYLVQGEYVEFDLVKTEDENHEYHAANVSGIKGGLLMCQTHSINNTVIRSYNPRPRRAFDEERSGPPSQSRERNTQKHEVRRGDVGRLLAEEQSSGDKDNSDGFTEVKRKSSQRKRSAGAPR